MEETTRSAKQFAVVTGASKGLGKALAAELASRKINLILVSLAGEHLTDLAAAISVEHQVEAVSYETDLCVTENVLKLADWINLHYSVYILINNAGLGGSKRFEEASSSYINKMLQLNVVATSLLTHQLLPNLKGQSQSYILNVSSMAAFLPCGYRTVYPASKSFVFIFSRSLSAELDGSNVCVSVASPGVMKTNEEVCRRIEKQGFLARLTMMEPARVARYCVRRMFKKDAVIIANGISWNILRVLPFWVKLKLMTLVSRRELDSDQ